MRFRNETTALCKGSTFLTLHWGNLNYLATDNEISQTGWQGPSTGLCRVEMRENLPAFTTSEPVLPNLHSAAGVSI